MATKKSSSRLGNQISAARPDLAPHPMAADYSYSCDPESDIGCPATLAPLTAEFAPHSHGMPRTPAAYGRSSPTQRVIKRYGWIRDLPDSRDHLYSSPLALRLPVRFDLRDHYSPFPPVYTQGDLGSCTANALAGAIQFERMRQKLPFSGDKPSRLFIYYNERVIAGTVDEDHGAQLRDGIKSVAHTGTCFEGRNTGQWDYVPSRFKTPPPKECFEMAVKDRVLGYSRILQSVDQMRGCLASGYPFVFGFTVYSSWKTSQKSGRVPLPGVDEPAIGGHAVMAVGYDDTTQQFMFRNSWGEKWGDKGYGTMPYTYLNNPHLAGDFWTIRLISRDSIHSRSRAA